MTRSTDEEFVTFVKDSSPRLLRSAWLICGDPVQAEELVQAALEKVYLKWRRIEPGQALAYTRKILLNQHIDNRRRSSREHLSESIVDRGHDDIHEDTRFLVAALSQLSLRERQVVVMRYYADQSEAQVADYLGVSLGTVKSSASRGPAHLRRLLVTEGGHHV